MPKDYGAEIGHKKFIELENVAKAMFPPKTKSLTCDIRQIAALADVSYQILLHHWHRKGRMGQVIYNKVKEVVNP